MSGAELAVVLPEEQPLSANAIQSQVNIIQQVMRQVMKEGEHYGKIPGTDKPSLYKPGAEKLSMTFRLAPRYAIEKVDLPNGHREYDVTCELTHIHTGVFLGSGVGCCSTMEAKYRWRWDFESTGKAVPKDYWKTRDPSLLGGRDFVARKDDDGRWMIFRKGERIENPDVADQFNTVLKMAKKRAHVDAVLTATAASDIFTQVEEPDPDEQPAETKKTASPRRQSKQDEIKKTLELFAKFGKTEGDLEEYAGTRSDEWGTRESELLAVYLKQLKEQDGAVKKPGGGKNVTPDQKAELEKAFKASSIDDEGLERYLSTNFKIKRFDDLPAEHFDVVLDWLGSQPKKGDGDLGLK